MKYTDLNNTYYSYEKEFESKIENVNIMNEEVEFSFSISKAAKEFAEYIVIVDLYRRVLWSSEFSKVNDCIFSVPLECFAQVPKNMNISIVLYNSKSTLIYNMDVSEDMKSNIRSEVLKKYDEKLPPEMPSYIDQHVSLIIDTTKHKYISQSNVDFIKTGNNYQTLNFDGIQRQGGRAARDKFLSAVKFTGKTVLDLGANTGEASRSARMLGAEMVDGYEYDSFFVETGRFINAARGMTRVSLFQGDISKPSFYQGKRYDIVMCLAVYVYTKNVMKHIAEVTDLLLYETHTLDHGLDMYLENVQEHFPFFKLIGYTNESTKYSRNRAFFLFSKSNIELKNNLNLKSVKTSNYFANRYFEKYPKTKPSAIDEYLNIIASRENVKKFKKFKEFKFGTEAYFVSYLIGYKEYLDGKKEIKPNNHFYVNFKEAIKNDIIDINLKKYLSEEKDLMNKVKAKYADIDNIISGKIHLSPPIEILRDPDGKLQFETLESETFKALNIDGHHRFFAYQLLSFNNVDAIISRSQVKIEKIITKNYEV